MSFTEVVGHERQLAILRSALERDRLHHAYLFVGPEGVGKRTVAVAYAKAVHCEEGNNNFCGQCTNCARISDGNHPEPVRSLEHAASGFSRAHTPAARGSRCHFALHHRPGGLPARPWRGLSAYNTLRLHLFRSGGDPLRISRNRVSLRVDRLLPGLEVPDRILQSSCRDSRVART